MVLGPQTINRTMDVYGFLGGMCEMMEAIPETFHMEPPKAIWWRITENSKMDWHSDVQTNKIQCKNFTTSARQKKQRTLEGTVLCDPWCACSRPSLFKFWFFLFLLCLELFVCNKMTWGDRSKQNTYTLKLDKPTQKNSDQPFWDKVECRYNSSLKIDHLDEELFRLK